MSIVTLTVSKSLTNHQTFGFLDSGSGMFKLI